MTPHPESIPINALVPVKGTPLENRKKIDSMEIIRVIATARIIMPKSRIRLSAGRKSFNKETQILCLLSGANSIFYGDNLLTTENNDMYEDKKLINEYCDVDNKIFNKQKKIKKKKSN